MSTKELNRLEILTAVKERRIKRAKAAQLLGISQRQLRRVLRRFNVEGAKGLVSKKVGTRGNRHLPETKKALVIDFFRDPDHYDFGPTLAQEYLIAGGAPKISVTAIRNVMIEQGLWQPKAIRKLNIHPLRPRRAKMGELIQLDGSPHDWFEGRGPRCTLLVFIDDATSNTMHLKFVKSENTMDYLIATREYVEKHGRPRTFYPDKHSAFRVNREGALSGDGRTQFGRMLKELEIQLICNSLQIVCNKLGEYFHMDDPASKQAFSQARSNFSHTCFQELNDMALQTFYQEDKNGIWNGYRVFAADGSTLRLPESSDTLAHFGRWDRGGENRSDACPVIGRISEFIDVISGLTVAAALLPWSIGEQTMAETQLRLIVERMKSLGQDRRFY